MRELDVFDDVERAVEACVVAVVVRVVFDEGVEMTPFRALLRVSCAAARLACWAVRMAWRALGSSVASVWPAVTA